MKEWFDDWKEKSNAFIFDYGKVFFVLFLFLINAIAIYLIIFLITPQPLRVSFLDVGQGDAIFIQTPSGKNMLIDGGASNIILTRLAREMNYFKHDVDVIVATHPDADHVTGLIPVLEKYNVKNIVTSPVDGTTQVFQDLKKHINDEQSDVYVARTGDVIDFHDGVSVRILYPNSADTRGTNAEGRRKNTDTNDASVSMVVSYGNETFLLTGDLPSNREPELIANGLHKDITVYKAGHHGSKTSSGEQLLTFIKPEYAIISAGENNKYGHPNIEAIERLQKYAKEIISTIDRGTISFVTDGRMMEVETDK
jgi:beta-lactamase superfamily II metal-dependent hydrolase